LVHASSPLCDWTGCYSDLLDKHLQACPWDLVSCPRGCEAAFLRRKDLECHLLAECPVATICDVCGEHVPVRSKASHDKSAAERHVEILKQRCHLLEIAQKRFDAVSPRCVGSWSLQAGTVALMQGASLRTAWARFGHSGWPHSVVARVRFFPRGTESSKVGHCAVEIVFEEAPVVVEFIISVTADATSRVVRNDSRAELMRTPALKYSKMTFVNFCALSQDELHGKLRVDVDIRSVSLLLRTES